MKSLVGQTLRKCLEPQFVFSATKSNNSRDYMFYASFAVGVKRLVGEVSTSGEPRQFCKNIPEKSGTEDFQKKSKITLST